jgi:hypothetical protein
MNRIVKACLGPAGVLLVMATMAVGQPPAGGQGPPKPLPPQSKAYGKTLTQWLKLLSTWAFGGDQGNGVGHVRFLPPILTQPDDPRTQVIDGFPYVVDEFALTVRPGTAYVVPVLGVYAETYNPNGGAPADDIHDPFIQGLLLQLFTELDVRVTLNGATLLDSQTHNLLPYVSAPFEFDETLFYDEPKVGLVDPGPPPVYQTSYGAFAGQVMGFAYPPLPVGQHVLKIVTKDEFLFGNGNIATYRITVQP